MPKDSLGLESQKSLPGPTSSGALEPKAKVPSSGGGASAASKKGYYQDANGRWHKPNGQFASNAEVGLPASGSNKSQSKGGGRLGTELPEHKTLKLVTI